jgi:DNA-binding transcriptional regulator YiaG
MNKTSKSKLAQVRVKTAVDNGVLVKPDKCEKCNKESKMLHGHHNDYDKPLEVVWLCPTCHAEEHNRYQDPNNSLALRFRQERIDLFPNKQEAAEAFGVTKGCLKHWENGARSIPKTAWILLDCLKDKKP